MLAKKGENEVLEVEVERLPPGEAEARPPEAEPRQAARRVGSALGPILAGLLVDALDAATLNPLVGLGLGFPLGLVIARQAGLRGRSAWQLAALIALYCGVPGTKFVPLGTIVGVITRVRQALAGGSP